jgi:hypothetical protein
MGNFVGNLLATIPTMTTYRTMQQIAAVTTAVTETADASTAPIGDASMPI